MGVSKGIISEFASGAREPSKDFLFGISKLGISIDWFLTEKGEMFSNGNIPRIPLMENLREMIENTVDPRLNDVESRLSVIEALLERKKPVPETDSDGNDPLYTSDPTPAYDEDEEDEEYGNIPYAHSIAAGPPISIDGDRGDAVRVPSRLLRQGERYYAATVRGSSMTGAGILDGDMALIRCADVPRDGAIQVVRHREKVTLKRLRETEGEGWELRYMDGSGRAITCDSDGYETLGEFVTVLPKKCRPRPP